MADDTGKMSSVVNKVRMRSKPLLRACLSEFCGTAVLMVFGSGVLAQVFLGDNGRFQHGSFISISLGWGMAVAFGVFFSGCGGSGNINPAVSLAFAIVGRLPFKRVPAYTLSQILGAFFGSLAVFGVYYEKIQLHATLHDDAQLLVNTTGGIFVTNPGASHLTCFFDQVLGTALLAAGALAITDFKGWKMPAYMHPLYLGLLVFTIVGAFVMNAGCALNPARDIGPRLMILICGWGTASFSHGSYFFWVPIFGPYLGAIIGAFLYEATIGIHLDEYPEVSSHVEMRKRREEMDGNDFKAQVQLLA